MFADSVLQSELSFEKENSSPIKYNLNKGEINGVDVVKELEQCITPNNRRKSFYITPTSNSRFDRTSTINRLARQSTPTPNISSNENTPPGMRTK